MTEYFFAEHTPRNTYMVKLHGDMVPGFYHHGGTLGRINAVMLNISYENYLRLCRDEFGGIIVGKNDVYPHAEFRNKDGALRLCDLLNPQMEKYVEYRKNLEKI